MPWGDTEVFFEAPQELSVTSPVHAPLSEEEVQSQLNHLRGARTIVLEYLPPPSAYRVILEKLAETEATVYITGWRMGTDSEAVDELNSLDKKPSLAPLQELQQEDLKVDSIGVILPITSRLLLKRVINSPTDYLKWLLRIRGINQPPEQTLELKCLELMHDSSGAILGAWTCRAEHTTDRHDFDSVVATPGPAPLDSTFYLTAQSIVIASEAVGGEPTILAVSECREGLGPPEFVKALYDNLRRGEGNLSDGPTDVLAWRLVEVLRSRRTYLVTALPKSIVNLLLGLKTFETLQEGVTQLLRLHGRSHKMLLLRESFHTTLI